MKMLVLASLAYNDLKGTSYRIGAKSRTYYTFNTKKKLWLKDFKGEMLRWNISKHLLIHIKRYLKELVV